MMSDLQSLYGLAEQNGIRVDDFAMQKEESISAMDLSDKACYIAIDCRKIHSTADECSVLAHELGHCMTGSFYNEYATNDVQQKHENIADRWAIEHVIPYCELNNAIIDGRDNVWDLADYFDVSLAFMQKALCWYIFGDLCITSYFSAV